MPRTGGESDKLGNRYEGRWTVLNILELLSGDALSISPESLEDSRGVEFIKSLRDGTREFHSVKRQRAGHGWRLSDLARMDQNGRSVLKDLFDKVEADPARKVVFVSATVHSQLYEIWDRSSRCENADDFKRQLTASKALDEDFTKCVVPLASHKFEKAFKFFRDFRLVSISEDELQRRVDQIIRISLYRRDGAEVDVGEVALKLADYISDSLGRIIEEQHIRENLASHGYHLRDWGRDENVAQQVEQLNSRYLRHVQSELIFGRFIPRTEVAAVVAALQSDAGKAQLIVGTSGHGKSCVLAQIFDRLRDACIPVVAFRLDNLPRLSTSRALGRELGLTDSPALVLAGLSQGKLSVLLIDQLDAVSMVSGRNSELWQVFEDLLDEVRRHPNLRLLVACRRFDLENDPRLAKLVKNGGPAERLDLALLPLETVKALIGEAGTDSERLSARELGLLQLPFHLYLFLHGDPANPVPFGGSQELFRRFWEAKRTRASQKNVDFDKVVGVLCDELSRSQNVSVPCDRLDSVAGDAKALVSENVLISEAGRYRFFHESFFDYAFARRFVRTGRGLIRFLTEECPEQNLFRRSQVRQILAYQRDDDRPEFIRVLAGFLVAPKIRLHLKKLVLEWLAQLEDPTEAEWHVIAPLLKDAKLNWGAFDILWGKVPWFDLLNRNGILTNLLTDPDNGFVDRCVRALALNELIRSRSAEIAKLFRPFRGKDDAWKRRFETILQAGQFHHSREMFDLVLELQKDGLCDYEENDPRWHHLTVTAQERPDYAVEFLVRRIERLVFQARSCGETNPFAGEKDNHQILEFIRTTAQHGPIEFAEHIAPMVKSLVLSNERPAECDGQYDEIWRPLALGTERDTADALLASLRRALQELARRNPEKCDSLLDGWEKLSHKTLRFLMLSAWVGNPGYFADRAAEHLSENPLALLADYAVSYGSDERSVAFPLLRAISPLIAAQTHAKLHVRV